MAITLSKIRLCIFPEPAKKAVSDDALFHTGSGDMIGNTHNKHYSVDGHELTSLLYTSGLINGRGRFDERKLPLTTFNVKHGNRSRYDKINGQLEIFEMTVEVFLKHCKQNCLHVVAYAEHHA